MATSHNVNAAKAFVARFEGAEKTVAASRNVSALLNFRTHRPLPSPAELEGKVSPLVTDEVSLNHLPSGKHIFYEELF